MTEDQKRRIDDTRRAVALKWEEAKVEVQSEVVRATHWTILLSSAGHGLVDAYGHTFPHASADHARINVIDEAIVNELRARALLSETTNAEAKLYRDLTGDAMAMGYDGITAALEALRQQAKP